jgi:hypothetical protein
MAKKDVGARKAGARSRPKRDTRSSAERLHEERAEKARLAWTQRHPAAAAAERALRKARVAVGERWTHKAEGTPETHEQASRRCQGALARLYTSGAIDAEQLGAAVEIATVAERIGADVTVRTASLETRVDVTRMGDGGFHERLGQVRREVAYTRWRAGVQRLLPDSGVAVAAVLDMVVGEAIGFTVAARRYRMHNRRAKQLLIDALDLWPRALGDACKAVDGEALSAVHARLAA